MFQQIYDLFHDQSRGLLEALWKHPLSASDEGSLHLLEGTQGGVISAGEGALQHWKSVTGHWLSGLIISYLGEKANFTQSRLNLEPLFPRSLIWMKAGGRKGRCRTRRKEITPVWRRWPDGQGALAAHLTVRLKLSLNLRIQYLLHCCEYNHWIWIWSAFAHMESTHSHFRSQQPPARGGESLIFVGEKTEPLRKWLNQGYTFIQKIFTMHPLFLLLAECDKKGKRHCLFPWGSHNPLR